METGRRETPDERIDRELNEFAQELRVAVSGVQVLFGFLLIVAFSERFRVLDTGDKRVYFVAVISSAISLVLYLAPAIHHRIRFRSGDKEQILLFGTVLAAIAAGALAIAITASLHFVTELVYGSSTAGLVAATIGGATSLLWFAVPFLYKHPPDHPREAKDTPPPPRKAPAGPPQAAPPDAAARVTGMTPRH